jgi:hypothetical protein
MTKLQELLVVDTCLQPTTLPGGFKRSTEPTYLRNPEELVYTLNETGQHIIAIAASPSIQIPITPFHIFQEEVLENRLQTLFDTLALSLTTLALPTVHPDQQEAFLAERLGGKPQQPSSPPGTVPTWQSKTTPASSS